MPQISFMNEIGIAMVVLIVAMLTSVRILREYERAVVFRLGRLTGARGPGLVLLIPFWIERMQRISLRTVVQDVTPQDVITKDNVSVSVNAVLTFRIVGFSKSCRRGRRFWICDQSTGADNPPKRPRKR